MNSPAPWDGKSGFTVIELIIVLAIVGMLAVTALELFNNYQADRFLDLTTEEMKLTLEEARLRAILGVNASAFGVYFEPTEGRFTLFQGDSFATRNQQYDAVHTWPQRLLLYTGPVEIVFDELKGTTLSNTITMRTTADKEKQIIIDAIGRIQ